MNKIKIFKEYDEVLINRFLEQTKGEIKNYNPIVIEYQGEYVDPYALTDVFVLPKEGYFVKKHDDYLDNKLRIYIDQISFSKIDGTIRFYYQNEIKIEFNPYKIDYLYFCIFRLDVEFGNSLSNDFFYYPHIDFKEELIKIGAIKLS